MERASSRFIRIFLELKHRIRLDNTWSNSTNTSASVAILFKQFSALAKQLNLAVAQLWPPEAVRFIENGQFIKGRPVGEYITVLQELEAFEPILEDYVFWKREVFKTWQLTNLFVGLLHFKLATDFRYSGALEGIEVGGAYAHSLAISTLNAGVVSKIDQLLADLIDPRKTVFDLQVLTTQFDYPTADYEAKYLQERLDEELGN